MLFIVLALVAMMMEDTSGCVTDILVIVVIAVEVTGGAVTVVVMVEGVGTV